MGTTGPGRTAFGSTQGARADHPPAGLGKAIITGLFGVARPIPAGLNQARIDPSPGSQGFALLGQALNSHSVPTLVQFRTLWRGIQGLEPVFQLSEIRYLFGRLLFPIGPFLLNEFRERAGPGLPQVRR